MPASQKAQTVEQLPGGVVALPTAALGVAIAGVLSLGGFLVRTIVGQASASMASYTAATDRTIKAYEDQIRRYEASIDELQRDNDRLRDLLTYGERLVARATRAAETVAHVAPGEKAP